MPLDRRRGIDALLLVAAVAAVSTSAPLVLEGGRSGADDRVLADRSGRNGHRTLRGAATRAARAGANAAHRRRRGGARRALRDLDIELVVYKRGVGRDPGLDPARVGGVPVSSNRSPPGVARHRGGDGRCRRRRRRRPVDLGSGGVRRRAGPGRGHARRDLRDARSGGEAVGADRHVHDRVLRRSRPWPSSRWPWSVGVDVVPASAATWGWILAITIGPQLLGHTLINAVLQRLDAVVVSVSILFEIVGATLLAWWWFGEIAAGRAVPGRGPARGRRVPRDLREPPTGPGDAGLIRRRRSRSRITPGPAPPVGQ